MTGKQLEQIVFYQNSQNIPKSIVTTELFNLIFSTVTFPDACKIAEVIPLHKKESDLEFNNSSHFIINYWENNRKTSP